jgi:hypothetical protein
VISQTIRILDSKHTDLFLGSRVNDPKHAPPGKTSIELGMMSVEELHAAVAKLPPDELGRFSRWFEDFMADLWDRQIERHIRAGRMDAAGRRADEQFESGNCTPIVS